MSWQLEQYGGAALWDQGRGEGVRVAVLDAATTVSTPLPAPRFQAFDDRGRPNDEQVSDHGYCCAALIGAEHDDASGVAPRCEVVSINIENSSGPNVSMVARGIRLALEKGCDLINCSFVLPTAPPTLLEALRDAHLAGVPVIAAAGNVAELFRFPHQVKDVVVVGGVDRGQEPMTGTVSKWVDVFTWGDGLSVASPGNTPTTWQGESSGATALVAGLVALAFGTLSVSERRRCGQDVEHHLTATAVRSSSSGRALLLVNALRFISAIRNSK